MNIYSLFIFAFLIRLINLNQSLWLDEAIVAKVVRSVSILQIPFQFSIHDFHPPLYYMFMSAWSTFFGSSEIALRFPSIIFSLIAGFYVYKIGSFLKDKKTAQWATAFFLFNPLIIYYSQESRMYMMATAFLTGALFHFIQIIQVQNPHKKHIFIFNIFSALALFTFYGSAFFIVGMLIVIFFLFPKKRKFILQMKMGFVLSLLLLSPLLLQQLSSAKTGLSVVKNWSLVLGKAEFKNFLMIFLKFATGRLSWYPKLSYYMCAGIATFFTWTIIAMGLKKNKVLSFLFFFPLCIGLLISFVSPMMMYFRFLYLIPVMSLLLVEPRIMEKLLVKVSLLTIFLVFSMLYLVNPQFHREDWKKLVQNMNTLKPVYMILPSSDPVVYYDSSLKILEIRTIQNDIPENIQVIPYVEEIYGYNHTEELSKKGCVRVAQSVYRGPLILEDWKCPLLLVGEANVSSI